ncbi:hypothetical protein JHL17_08635 [Azospirillum sp. YIM B02556]|uniref:Uncharacterized protein n=1 Tax=Azospirillum endophyticum TaxID=2800326 RepID=A0ABS1F233_9PROT|nr:hypothetical protein [Azospirillum endophyticum]MBK1837477.1 hypothetical protein [Azospirillum endophyticum]
MPYIILAWSLAQAAEDGPVTVTDRDEPAFLDQQPTPCGLAFCKRLSQNATRNAAPPFSVTKI